MHCGDMSLICSRSGAKLTERRTSHTNRTSIFDKPKTFGLRGSADRESRRSALAAPAPERQAITRALAPTEAVVQKSVRKGRRVKPTETPTVPPSPPALPPSAKSADPNPNIGAGLIDSAATLGQAIKVRRTSLGFSQQRLADLAGVGRRFISELEGGKPSLEFDRVLQCCAALGIDLFARSRG